MPTAAGASSAQVLFSKLQWRNVGPWIGGRVVALTGVPTQSNLFYMGAVDGGVWKSTDYGIMWTNLTDGKLPSSSDSIGAIAVAPSNPSVIYAGTGESDIRGDVITGDGVFRSTDAGKTWRYAGLGDTHTISSILVDPRRPDVVYASSMGHVFKPNADRGVFKSTDGGKKWRKILFVDDSTGAIDLAMEPKHPDVLYAAMWQAYRTPWSLSSGGPGSGLYKSIDGGAHWTNLTPNSGLPHGRLGRIGVSVAASDPRVVYAIIQAKEGGVFRSNDGGATWKRANGEWKLRQRAFYYMSVYADPTNANTVYVPEVDALWVSHDGAKNFSQLHTPHGDNHTVWINPNDPHILLEGNDGGATVSTDAGATWSSEHNQPTGQFYHVGLDDQFPFHIYGAQQDEGSIEGPSASSSGSISSDEWHNVAYGESTFVVPQPGAPSITYGSGYFSIFLRYDMATGEYRSVSLWPNYQEGASSGELKYRFGWTHPILFSAADPKELLVGSQYVLKSDDEGQIWQRISPDLTRNDLKTEAPSGGPIDLDESSAEVYPDVSALAVSPLDANHIWAGSADGLVHVTNDGGSHWTDITPPQLPQWAEITSIEPSHVSKATAYLSASRYMWDDFAPYVFETSDNGAHWTALSAGLPADQYVFAVRQDPDAANVLFAGTKNTVYVSLDGGLAWQPLGLNLPRVQVRDIALDTRQGAVAIATHGRAFWVLDNLALIEQVSKAGPAGEPQLLAPQAAWLSHAYGASGRTAPTSGTNPPFGATVFFDLPSNYNGKTPVSLAFSDSQGRLVRTFNLHLKSGRPKPDQQTLDVQTPAERKQRAQEELSAVGPGMNRFQWNLRYPDATEVNGFYVPIAAGGLPDEVDGPTVAPGDYTVVLRYGAQQAQQPLQVKLDPRMHVAADALGARLGLQLSINRTLDTLDRTINEAIAVRDKLLGGSDASARAKIAALDTELGNLVQLDVHSSEGTLLHETKLRSHLAYLASDIDLAYDKPTAAQYAVFQELGGQAKAGEQRLRAAMAAAR
ncbi:MAG: glycosyl hydrolase [Candidatus Eremiobacteraeota bacterium]|nr:glycosyl hydrolase [Candidatus Eremiobacteraeota bacterium]